MKIFYLPDLGEGLTEAEIRKWYVNIGDVVNVDEPLVSMETAKAVVDVPSPYSGKIIALHGKVNDVIKTGETLVSFETDANLHETPKGSVVGSLEESTKTWDEGDVRMGLANMLSKPIKAMPSARVLAKEMNIDLRQVTPTGPQGLITPDDVKRSLGLMDQQESVAKRQGQSEILHGVRRTMALTMVQSHQEVVPVTIFEDADITDYPSNTDITVKLLQAIVAAAKVERALNAWFNGRNLERTLRNEVNIGLAVDTEEGLFVPVIAHAEAQSAQGLRQMVDHLKAHVRNRCLLPKELQGATITLSNFGMLLGRYATPIIVPPTVAILGCGRSRDVVIPRHGQIVIGRHLPLSLTFDHRAATGAESTRFLAAVIDYLQQ